MVAGAAHSRIAASAEQLRANRTSGRNGSSVYTRGPVVATKADPLAPFGPAVRAWFEATFEAPTPAQSEGWAAIAAGPHTLIHAPTGSGKTLAAFLWCLDRLVQRPTPAADARTARHRPRPVRLPAQGADVRRRAQPPRAPRRASPSRPPRLGDQPPRISVASRTGDTPAEERRELVRHPPDILVTTPGEPVPPADQPGPRDARGRRARDRRRGPRDRRHQARRPPRPEPRTPRAPAGRGRTRGRSQRIGLSAPPSGRSRRSPGSSAASATGREVEIVDAGTRKPLELQVVVPVEDMARLGEVLPLDEQPGGPVVGGELRTSIWPAIHPRILELIREPPLARSCSPTAAGSPSGSRSASTSSPARSWSAPITAASPGSSASRSRRS